MATTSDVPQNLPPGAQNTAQLSQWYDSFCAAENDRELHRVWQQIPVAQQPAFTAMLQERLAAAQTSLAEDAGDLAARLAVVEGILATKLDQKRAEDVAAA